MIIKKKIKTPFSHIW